MCLQRSACVSAAFRLATTVAYGEAADAIYALGPLVFWATAEMTCGFFVCCSKSHKPCTYASPTDFHEKNKNRKSWLENKQHSRNGC